MVAMVEDAQDCVLHRLLSLPDPEQFPPFCSFLILLRDLVLVPPPQDFEQGDQNDQIPQTQSSGKTTAIQNLCFFHWIGEILNYQRLKPTY